METEVAEEEYVVKVSLWPPVELNISASSKVRAEARALETVSLDVSNYVDTTARLKEPADTEDMFEDK